MAALIIAAIRFEPLRLGAIDDYVRSTWPEPAANSISNTIKSKLEYRADHDHQYVFLGDSDSYFWLRLARNVERNGTVCDATIEGRCWDTIARAPHGRPNLFAHSLHVYTIAYLHRILNLIVPGYPLAASAFIVPVVVGVLGAFPAFAIGMRLGGMAGGFAAAIVIGLNPLFLRRSIGSDNDVWNVVLPICILWLIVKAIEADGARRQILFVMAASALVGVHAGIWSGWIFGYGAIMTGLGSSIALLLVQRTLWREASSLRAALVRDAVVAGAFCIAAILAARAVGGNVEITIRSFGLHAGSIWPSNLGAGPASGIEEMQKVNLAGVASALGGWPLTVIGIGGLLLLVRQLFAFADEHRELTAIILVWAMAASVMATEGSRFILLLVPPFGFAIAAAIGAASGLIGAIANLLSNTSSTLLRSAAALAFVAIVLMAILGGYHEARAYVPAMNAAWWSALEGIRQRSPSDSIVVTWWDFGYWAEYYADRRVLADGGSVRGHLPYWLGKALLAPSERDSIGLLRMLECGGDSADGAFAKLRALGMGEASAADVLASIAPLNRVQARAALERFGLDGKMSDDILQTTHCVPPPSYLVLSSSMNSMPGWIYDARWDLHRNALAAFQNSFAGEPGYVVDNWLPCLPTDQSSMQCPMQELRDIPLATGDLLHEIDFPVGHPEAVTSQIRTTAHITRDFAPATLFLARQGALEEIPLGSPMSPSLAVLIDADHNKVLPAPAELIRSTYTRLMFLDPRYSQQFQKIDERIGYGGERVLVWKIRWDHVDAASGTISLGGGSSH